MNITELTEHQIRNWPAERVKVFVDSGEYDPLDLSPLQTEVKELGACDYRSNCERYAVLRFQSIDELIVSMSHERKLFEEKLEQLKAYKTVQIIVEADYEKFATGKYDRDMLLKAAKATITSWEIQYNVHVNFVGNRQFAEDEAYRFFYYSNRQDLREKAGYANA